MPKEGNNEEGKLSLVTLNLAFFNQMCYNCWNNPGCLVTNLGKKVNLGTNRLRPRWGQGFWRGEGYNFLSIEAWFWGVNFENVQSVRGVEILRHRTGLLCKSCQIILWLKQIHNLVPRVLFPRFGGGAVSQWYGHPCILGIPIPISLAFWASPVIASTLPKLFQTGEKSRLSITNLRLNSVDAC